MLVSFEGSLSLSLSLSLFVVILFSNRAGICCLVDQGFSELSVL